MDSFTVKEASMSMLDLNNFVVGLVKPLRDARVRVIRHLTSKMRSMKNSKKASDVIEKKCNNMLQEIHEIKALTLNNDAVKNLLAKVYTEKDLSRAGTPGDRALVRVAIQKSPFLDKVTAFRRDHEDWESLTQFLLSKHGGRRFRRRNAKVSTEKLAKATLDVADTRAREQFAAHDQRHQHNKRAIKIPSKQAGEEKVMEVVESIETCEDQSDERSSQVHDSGEGQISWMSSIFSVTKESNEEAEANNEDSVVPAKARTSETKKRSFGESVVYKFDPKALDAPRNEDDKLALPIEEPAKLLKIAENRGSYLLATEEEDFFMPLGDDNDEISRVGGQSLSAREVPFDDNDNCSKFGSRRQGSSDFQSKARKAPAEKLHASWEARRMERAQQQISVGKSAAKIHIKFDDNDDDDAN